ncbi:mannose-6-phosphate isomerase, class I [Nocardioides pantholopis]|uniref:mannose-6-phosphate isomerase, class I n=1 Tax=Nocardioides pantholopis TaxID=2483798 RepID=UPI000FD8494C|nr:mannose-6-phosphate isomerase, class I [Nocardioides pantholopis]
MLRLDCPTHGYEWGSANDIPAFLRQDADGSPVAEVWMGTHPLGTAVARHDEGDRPLTDVAGELPFMLKILAASSPLSVQVHPDRARAQAGFAREEAAGVPLDAPERVFKDPHPKPEMVYALTTFDTLVGFRPTAEILRVLAPLNHPYAKALTEDLRSDPGFPGIVRLVGRILADDGVAEAVPGIVAECQAAHDLGIDVKRAYATALEIEKHHPDDPGVIVSLLLNRLTLQPGEAAYLGAGIIHAHLSGMCLEVMVASDNVLRAGLTGKHIDRNGLVDALQAGMSRVARVAPDQFGFSTDVFSPSGEFALAIAQASQAEPLGAVLPETGKRLLVCTGGEVAVVNGQGASLWLKRGDAAYADEADGELRVIGTGEVAQAYLPPADAPHRPMTDLV